MNKTIQHKLLSYEIAPPSGVWKKIAKELDDSELDHVFPNTLYEAAVAAPPGTWNKIAAALNAGDDVVLPQKRRIAPFVRYAAAAIVVGLVVWGGIKLFNNSKKDEVAKTPSKIEITPVVPNPETPSIATVIPETNSGKTDEQRNDDALEASKKTFAKLDRPFRNHQLRDIASSFSFASNSELIDPSESEITTRDAGDISSRYIVLMTPEGHFIRMSKKLDNLVCCVSGEEQDKDCKEQMSKWREQVACSPTGHSTGSFLDILSLIKSLEDQ